MYLLPENKMVDILFCYMVAILQYWNAYF